MSRPEEHAVEGLEHLQTAALELIAAGKAFLDAAEEVVRRVGTPNASSTRPTETKVRRIHVS